MIRRRLFTFGPHYGLLQRDRLRLSVPGPYLCRADHLPVCADSPVFRIWVMERVAGSGIHQLYHYRDIPQEIPGKVQLCLKRKQRLHMIDAKPLLFFIIFRG